ncbi:hypothetical protein BDW71DRAFT_205270 [Aspergillus fruticulosus]
MTTVTTLTATLVGKRPADYEYEKITINQRENISSRTPTRAQTRTQPAKTPSVRQRALLVHAAQQPYALETDHAVPAILHKDEILTKVVAIDLNPVDWKGPANNFGSRFSPG